MTDYKKLVEALRCGEYKPECGSSDCPYWSGLGCMDGQACEDAAAAIEALQAEVDALKHDIERYVQMNTELLNDRPELEEIGGKWVWKEPKRGKWFEENIRPRSSQFVCSECHGKAYYPQPTRDKMWTKRCGYAYCPHCGADMRAKMEVQDG